MPAYRLQTLLEIRERAEEEAKNAFSVAVRALAAENEALKALEVDLEQRKANRKQRVQEHLAEVMQKGGGAGGFAAMNRFEARLKDEEAQVGLEIERQKEAVRQAEKLVEERRREMAEAAMEKKAIEKHKETWTKQVRFERQQKEDLNQEEIGNTLHLQRTRNQKMSRVDDDREDARVAARLAEQKRTDEARKTERQAADSKFSKMVGQQKGEAQKAQGDKMGRSAIAALLEKADADSHTETGQLTQHDELSHQDDRGARARLGAKSVGEKQTMGARAEGEKGSRSKLITDQGNADARAGRSADTKAASQTSSSRNADSQVKSESLSERASASDSASDAHNQAGKGAKGGLKTDADKGGGGQQQSGGGDKKGSEVPANFRYNPALAAPVPVAKKNDLQGSDRLRRMASEIAQKIVERVRVGTNSLGNAEFQIDMRNDVMGGMTVKVSAKNGKISAVFSGSDKNVLKMLEEQAESLKGALSSRGLTLENFKVEARA